MENLIDLQTGILLNKFGQGNHKPGSGSAVALQGMLAAQMIRTVIDLTKERPAYKNIYKDLEVLVKEIEDKIYPALEDLIQRDSVQFGKAIDARIARDGEQNLDLKVKYASEALEDLKLATEIPIAVAKYCIRLTEMGIYIFDNCFQSARGDSSVAINGALSAVSGCLAIINLNLLSFRSDDWTIKMRNEADNIKEARDLFTLQENDRQKDLQKEADQLHKFHLEINELQSRLEQKSRLSNTDIENLVSAIQNCMWKYRDSIWKRNTTNQPVEIIDPIRLLKKLGYQYKEFENLENYENEDGRFEVAGIIDTQKKHVSISQNFLPETINFTVAHELGHAILHPNQTLHRDRPMDGAAPVFTNDLKEIQANRFASNFLMPRKILAKQFNARFLSDKFEINTQTALRFGVQVRELRDMCKSKRDLSRLLASAEFYNGAAFHSISEQFQVSMETMAIRLEELDLVTY